MNIDYLDTVLSVCFTMRKMKTIFIEEDNGKIFKMRPQLHVMLISPFGTFKSSLTRQLESKFKRVVYPVDDFTKAGMEGSIAKDGEYIPPMVVSLGGKVLVIDEWNNVDFFGQGSLLGLLENQRVSRTLGFKVKRPFNFKTKYGWVNIDENHIEGEMIFSCIAHAMVYPVQNQRDKALLSRFTPLFIEPTLDYIKQNTKGNFKIKVDDYSQEIESVTITYEVYKDFHDSYFKYILDYDLVPLNSDDFGFLSRTMSDIIRMGVFDYLSKNNHLEKDIIINDSIHFKNMFIYINTLMSQFNNPKTSDKIYQYRTLLKKSPGQTKEFYYRALGISRQTLWQYDKLLGNDCEVNYDENREEVDKKRLCEEIK